jgi:hypothetical protein
VSDNTDLPLRAVRLTSIGPDEKDAQTTIGMGAI